MQIRLFSVLLALLPLLAAATPAPGPITKVPFSKRRSFQKAYGAVDIPALTAHVEQVRA